MHLREIERRLVIDKHQLDDELMVQAQIQYAIVEKVSALTEDYSKSRELLKIIESEIVQDLTAGDSKHTVKQLDALIQSSAEYQDAAQGLREAQKDLDKAQGLLDAWKQRGFALKALADLSLSNYYAMDSTSSRKVLSEKRNERRNLERR